MEHSRVGQIELVLRAATRQVFHSLATDVGSIQEARAEVEELLEIAVGRVSGRHPSVGLTLELGDEVRFACLVKRRASGEPLARIRGHVDFAGLRLPVQRSVFTPRSSTELLVKEAVRRLRSRPAPVAVDVATGSGAVALGVAAALPNARVVGLDISRRAVAAARANARRLGLANADFYRSDGLLNTPWSLARAVDVVTANPPNFPRDQVGSLPLEITAYEPRVSLSDGSRDGLGLVRQLSREIGDWARCGGWLLVEVTPSCAPAALRIAQATGMEARVIRPPSHPTSVVAMTLRD